MNSILRPYFVVVVLISSLLGLASADERPPLTREIASKIISEANQIRENEVNVGPMHVVERKIDKSTTATDGLCVTFIAPQIKNGTRRRVVQTRTFFYDHEWGWYLYATEGVRGGEAIDVVSELKGRFEMR